MIFHSVYMMTTDWLRLEEVFLENWAWTFSLRKPNTLVNDVLVTDHDRDIDKCEALTTHANLSLLEEIESGRFTPADLRRGYKANPLAWSFSDLMASRTVHTT